MKYLYALWIFWHDRKTVFSITWNYVRKIRWITATYSQPDKIKAAVLQLETSALMNGVGKNNKSEENIEIKRFTLLKVGWWNYSNEREKIVYIWVSIDCAQGEWTIWIK